MDKDTEVRLAVYRHFAATGVAPTMPAIAGELALQTDEVAASFQRLRANRTLYLEPDGETIRMAPPFSAVPTQHRVVVAGVTYHANCAWDAPGVAAALQQPAVVYSRCEQSHTPLELPIEPARAAELPCTLRHLGFELQPPPAMIPRLAVLLLLLGSASNLPAQQSLNASGAAWHAVFKHDSQGRPLGGDKQQLIDGIRRGLAVRLAWGVRHPRDSTRSVEHTALPVFLTIVDNAEVFVQVAEHLAYADYWDPASQAIGDPRVTWSAILGTTGAFNALWYNRATGELVRRLPQRVSITWYLEGEPSDQRAPPLYAPVPPALSPPA